MEHRAEAQSTKPDGLQAQPPLYLRGVVIRAAIARGTAVNERTDTDDSSSASRSDLCLVSSRNISRASGEGAQCNAAYSSAIARRAWTSSDATALLVSWAERRR
eukprot:Hpha_TRINITY_DN15252_c2_g3::TRINITY_DN15252_c2_g3_i1::g.68098::m.68098